MRTPDGQPSPVSSPFDTIVARGPRRQCCSRCHGRGNARLSARSQACAWARRGSPGRQGGAAPDRYPAIEDHAVIGDLHTVALVATDGTIDWSCLPRFDSPAMFRVPAGRGPWRQLRGPVRSGPDQAAVHARFQRAGDQVPGHRLGRRGDRLHGSPPRRRTAGATWAPAGPSAAGGPGNRRLHDHLPPGI
jgi:hypothetical protein